MPRSLLHQLHPEEEFPFVSAAATQTVSVPYINILVRFSDSISTTPKPLTYYDNLFRDPAPGVGYYFKEQSFGKMNIAGTKTVGWLNLPKPRSYYLDSTKFVGFDMDKIIADACVVADSQVDFTKFYGINVLVNVPIGNIGGVAGLPTLKLDGRTGAWGATVNNPHAFAKSVSA